MKELSQITACVIDHGLYLPLARHLAKTYKRVLYWSQWETGFPTINDCLIGDGFDDVERCDDIWSVKNEVDLFVFPDIYHSGLQKELVSQGKPVWGSRDGDSLEIKREKFHRTLGEVGLTVPTYKVCVGMSELRKYLNDKENKYVKISKYRGSLETKKFRNMDLDGLMMDLWQVKYGPAAELLRFLVFDEIPTNLELGADTYNVLGEFPDLMLNGLEAKDKGYLGAVTKRDEMPEQIQDVLTAFAPILGKHDYRNNFSMEVRVSDDDFYFIDPCCRYPMPGTSAQFNVFKNMAEIIYMGALGELIQPEPKSEFVAECCLSMKSEKGEWSKMRFDESLEPNINLSNCCMIDGAYCWPPTEHHGQEIGWLTTTGDSIKEVVENMRELCGSLPDGADCKTDSLFELLKEVHEAHDEGIPFTDKHVPEPVSAIEE